MPTSNNDNLQAWIPLVDGRSEIAAQSPGVLTSPSQKVTPDILEFLLIDKLEDQIRAFPDPWPAAARQAQQMLSDPWRIMYGSARGIAESLANHPAMLELSQGVDWDASPCTDLSPMEAKEILEEQTLEPLTQRMEI